MAGVFLTCSETRTLHGSVHGGGPSHRFAPRDPGPPVSHARCSLMYCTWGRLAGAAAAAAGRCHIGIGMMLPTWPAMEHGLGATGSRDTCVEYTCMSHSSFLIAIGLNSSTFPGHIRFVLFFQNILGLAYLNYEI